VGDARDMTGRTSTLAPRPSPAAADATVADSVGAVPTDRKGDQDRPPAGLGSRRRDAGRWPPVASLAVAFAAYLALSVVLWWQVWSTHPASTTACGCGDTSLFLWFLQWPAYAIAHGHNLFYSSALFHPAGVDLLSNTSVLAIGVPLAPVTWLWGPVATLNVASTLTPALSALSMCWLLRRWVQWTPAAFVGGLVFGFSPFVVMNLAGSHLMTAALALLPLMVACLDELLVRQRHRAATVGGALGVLLTVQFFVGTEVLAMVVVMGAVAVVLVAAYAAVGHRDELLARAPHAAKGLGAAALVAVVLLAYPVWVALAGPAHLSGLVWPSIAPGLGGIQLSHVAHPAYLTALQRQMLATGGYQGPALLTGGYLGVGFLVVLACGLLGFLRDRRLWCFGAVGLVAAILALGSQSYWTPWRVIAKIPVLQNVIPGRLMAVVTLSLAVMLGVIVDRTRTAVLAVGSAGVSGDGEDRRTAPRAHHRAGARGEGGRRSTGRSGARLAAGVAALAVAALAVVPMATALASNVPLTARPVAVPRWFATVGSHLPPGRVVLAYPAPFALEQSAEDWQAVDGLRFALVGGSGPGSIPSRAGDERAGQAVIGAASFSLSGPPAVTAANVEAVRQALAGWGVTTVVVPDTSNLPRYERGTDPAAAVGLFTLAIGRAPRFVADAWVWEGVDTPADRRTITQDDFTRCTAEVRPGAARSAVPACVLAASHPVP
jgi:hypothetical protein